MRQPFTQLYVHLVWRTYNRLPWIAPDLEPPIYACIAHKVGELGGKTVAIGGDFDHVHLLARFTPSLSIARLVGEAKGCSAHLVNSQYPQKIHFRWQGAYGAFTVSPSAVNKVADYVRCQKQHHEHKNLHEEWEEVFLPDDWVWREER